MKLNKQYKKDNHLHRASFYENIFELEHPIESTFFHPLGLEIVYNELSNRQSTEESFGQNCVARQSDLEGCVHLEHKTIRQDVVKGLEVSHILANQCNVFQVPLTAFAFRKKFFTLTS
ncbi:hypothetical protein CEXT_324361 [Caerostris extrusa]|uniref:Uncharacterized protein n=1 Tax=Caerostris extrusa TaxID=172846 RepID=A0AAV4VBI0_CAEEX|nr:hypothetical protein CEXT_324361 [Caerostris extrusa]